MSKFEGQVSLESRGRALVEALGGTWSRSKGTDLTFSMPKSWSLIALVGGDERILEAYAEAVKETLGWAEKNLAETRIEVNGREKVVATGKLLVALFSHDTNRNQEPNAHIHAVVANATQGPDGKWRALRNDKLWEHNTLLNAITMARFRLPVEKLGYEIGEVGKHGNFEAAGVPRAVVEAFSTRRAELLAMAERLDHKSPAATDAATLMSRADKVPIEDRAALAQQWADKAAAIGFDPGAVIARANSRAAIGLGQAGGITSAVRLAATRGRELVTDIAERLGLREGDPLVPTDLWRRSPEDVAAIHAVAAGVRHLAEREAAFARTDLYRAALGFGLAASMPAIERRVAQLERSGQLKRGAGADRGLVTTAGAIAVEQRIVAAIEHASMNPVPCLVPDRAIARSGDSFSGKNPLIVRSKQSTAPRAKGDPMGERILGSISRYGPDTIDQLFMTGIRDLGNPRGGEKPQQHASLKMLRFVHKRLQEPLDLLDAQFSGTRRFGKSQVTEPARWIYLQTYFKPAQ